MIRIASVLVALAGMLTGCSLHGLREQLAEPLKLAVLGGRVVPSQPLPRNTPLRVAAVSSDTAAPVLAHDVLLREAGEFELFLPAGRYQLLAFADLNNDGRATPDEPAARQEGLTLSVGEWRMDLVLRLEDAPPEEHPAVSTLHARQDTLAGAHAVLEDPRYGHDYALAMGYWNGAAFLREMGSNVHALQVFDPARIPVLFVYGARGDPQDWRYLIDQLDRKRFQPWFYYYPSGVPARITAPLLARKLASLQRQYDFDRLYVVAHSAGGLLVRHMLVESAPMPWLTRFISIATPWGGEPISAFGLRHSPVIVPAWEDLVPDGKFIAELYEKPLPPHVEHSLLYGQRSGWPLFLDDSDGSIPLSSLRDRRALSGAQRVEAFDETHRSILVSASVATRLNTLLQAP
ncbi:hypothetical protein VVD49_11685 [Uliginosibacterium sp. H3]|uniref:Alpha/beta hydrolase n=1 Tax=Uliginosibacterium silvisoli TaxID=3114758 RepID=A0ABU6K3C2_9RHOO|nr:hypothetical protein [Uliginosibacterium sp. H3]